LSGALIIRWPVGENTTPASAFALKAKYPAMFCRVRSLT
jgi:hypothetical protein